MNIEIHAPQLEVSNKLVEVIRKKILSLSHLAENISRAEIYLAEHHEMRGQNKSCKIRLSIFGEAVFVHKYGDSFEKAFKSAATSLKRNMKKQLEKRNQLPDEITSTVEI
jgi:ribosomal subunit interface protein